MEAKELRIGNYLQDREGNLCRVDTLCRDIDDCGIYRIGHSTTRLPVKPIPLTDDWMARFGIEINSSFNQYSIDVEGTEYVLEKQGDWFFIGVKHNSRRTYFSWEIKYVHQLQNLYFALTGKELTC